MTTKAGPEESGPIDPRDSDAVPLLSAQDRKAVAERAGHLSWCVRFGLDQPETMQGVLAAANELHAAADLDAIAEGVLAQALSVMAADFGNVQIMDQTTGALRIVAQSGFDSEFLEYFAVVDDTTSVCGRAAQASAQMVIPDVSIDPGFAPHRDIAATTGFRGVQSTPLLDHSGHVVGMVSTHFRHPHRPSQRDLALLALYGDFAGEVTARHLRNGSESGAKVSTFARGPQRLRPIDLRTEVSDRLGDVTLALSEALDHTGNRVAREHIGWALGEVDEVIEQVRHLCRSPEGTCRHEHCNTAAFAELGDRLVRKLFDCGLRLNRVSTAFNGETPTSAELRRALEAVGEAVDDLDAMIRDTGMSMLTLTSAVPIAELGTRRRRR